MDTSTLFAQFSPNQKRIIVLTAILLCLVLISIILQELESILKPFFVAVFMVILLEPGVIFLIKLKIPRVVAYLIMILLVFVVLYLMGMVLYANLDGVTRNILDYEAKLNSIIGGSLKKFGIIDKTAVFKLRELAFMKWLPTGSITAFFRSSLGTFFDLIGNGAVVLFFMLFIIAEIHIFKRRMIQAYGEEKSQYILTMVQNINRRVQQYILVKLGVSLGTGILATVIMALFGLDLFGFFGVLVFILNFIPYLGSIIATIFPVIIAFLQYDSPWTAVWLLIILIVVQNLMGTLIEPRVAGKRLNLSPLIVLISVMFWGWLWGSVGMLLSIPILATIHIILKNTSATRGVALLISDL